MNPIIKLYRTLKPQPKTLTREQIEEISLWKSIFRQGSEMGVISDYREWGELEKTLQKHDCSLDLFTN